MEFVIGGLAATSAGILTNLLEVVKHHMEISKKSQFTNRYQNFFHAGFKVAKQEGFKSLQKGLSPALGAHLISYGTKLGTYQYAMEKGLTKKANGKTDVLNSISTSAIGGLLGQFMSNPFYLLKAQHYADSGDCAQKNKTYWDTAKRILREHGIRGFFRGATASLPRAFIGTSQLTSFAVAKETLSNCDWFANHPLIVTVLSGTVAGLVLSAAMTPFETVLSTMYKQAIDPRTTKRHSGYVDCIRNIYKSDGLRPFYRGMGSIYLKLGPHTALCLVFWEELKGAYADNYGASAALTQTKLDLYRSFGFDLTGDFNKAAEEREDRATILYL